MRLYSDYPARAFRQLLGDVLALLIIVIAVLAGLAVHSSVAQLADVGSQLQSAGDGFESSMRSAADATGSVPLLGDGLSNAIGGPLSAAGDAGGTLAAAGQAWHDGLLMAATIGGVLVALGPIVVVLALWTPLRLLPARRAARVRALALSPAGTGLLALRALTTRRIGELMKVDPDPLGAWRRGDEQVIGALAATELRRAGVKPPRRRAR